MNSSATRDVRAEILAAGTELFVVHGYHGLSMRQIAEAVGVTKAALYYHFENKEALFLAILAKYLERAEEMILQVQAESNTCRQRIRLLVQRTLRQPAEQRAVIRLASQEIVQVSAPARRAFRVTYHERFIGVIRAMLEAGIASGELRPVDPHLATWTLLGMLHPYLYPADSDDAELSDEAIEQMVTIYLDGVSMPEE
jgi:AcrR family transcriptional regulator